MDTTLPRALPALCSAVLALGGSGSCMPDDALRPLPEGGHHVLFIGNSLTGANNLPATVAAIAASVGDTIRVVAVVGNGLALIDHYLGATRALEAIALGGWDYVIMQQGPTSTGGICQDSLVLSAQLLATEIRTAGGTPALFEVWPAADRLPYFDNVRQAYQSAAAAVGGVFMPAGEAWRAAWDSSDVLPLYGSDGFHPSAVGTFLAALTIYERITGSDPRLLPAQAFANGARFTLAPDVIRLLQGAAHDANGRFAAFPAAPAPWQAPRPAPGGIRC